MAKLKIFIKSDATVIMIEQDLYSLRPSSKKDTDDADDVYGSDDSENKNGSDDESVNDNFERMDCSADGVASPDVTEMDCSEDAVLSDDSESNDNSDDEAVSDDSGEQLKRVGFFGIKNAHEKMSSPLRNPRVTLNGMS